MKQFLNNVGADTAYVIANKTWGGIALFLAGVIVGFLALAMALQGRS